VLGNTGSFIRDVASAWLITGLSDNPTAVALMQTAGSSGCSCLCAMRARYEARPSGDSGKNRPTCTRIFDGRAWQKSLHFSPFAYGLFAVIWTASVLGNTGSFIRDVASAWLITGPVVVRQQQ
jgi:hypothetical protein